MSDPQRIQLSRARGWRKPEGAIVVARPSRWGNPWRVGQPVWRSLRGTMDADLLLAIANRNEMAGHDV